MVDRTMTKILTAAMAKAFKRLRYPRNVRWSLAHPLIRSSKPTMSRSCSGIGMGSMLRSRLRGTSTRTAARSWISVLPQAPLRLLVRPRFLNELTEQSLGKCGQRFSGRCLRSHRSFLLHRHIHDMSLICL